MNFKKIVLAGLAACAMSANASVLLIQNGGFENNDVGYGGFSYSSDASGEVAAPSWAFAGLSGISVNSGAWGANAPEGTSFAYLQSASQSGIASGSVSQVFNTSDLSDLTVTFKLAQRTNCCGDIGGQIVGVSLDGVQLQAYQPNYSNGDWFDYSLSALGVTAGSHTLTFSGVNQTSTDTTAFVDNVQVAAELQTAAIPEPASLAILGLGLIGLTATRRKAAKK